MPPHAVGAHRFVGGHVEQRAVVARPSRPAPGDVADHVVGVAAGEQVANPQHVLLAAIGICAPRQQLLIGADVEGVECEEVVTLGLHVLVEQQVGACVSGGAAAAVDRVVLALLGAGDVPPSAIADRGSGVGLLDARLDLLEDLLDELVMIVEPGVGERVLGLEVGDRVRVAAVAQPGPWIGDSAGRAIPVVFDLLGDGFVHAVHDNGRSRPVEVRCRHGSVEPVRVWIDQDLCTGDGLCLDHCPDVFVQLEDGIAYVAEGEVVLNDPGGGESLATVAPRNERAVIHAALACPGECIFIDVQQIIAA